MTKDRRKIAIYSRKSKFTGKGESIENQIAICKSRIQAQYPSIADEDILIFEDEGFSGGNTNRPQFKAMMAAVKNKEIQAIYSYRLDRISRSVVDFANMYEVLTELNVAYISATECYETSTPLGRAMMSIATVFAQLERETIAERIRDNMHALAKSGRWLGGTTPTGYKSTQIVGSITVDGKERKAYKLEPIPQEAQTIRLIFSKFAEFGSLTKVETYLLQSGIKSKTRKNHTRFSIKAILQNPVYMTADEAAWNYFNGLGIEIYATKADFNGHHGIMAYNKTLQRDGKANRQKEPDEWIVAVGKHEPLIESRVWIHTQTLLAQNNVKAYRKPKSHNALLSGLLFCSDCNSFMRPKKTKRLNADGEEIFSYLCEMKEKSHGVNCRIKNVNGNSLDKAICEEIRKLSQNDSDFIQGLLNASKQLNHNSDEYTQQIDTLRKSLHENEKQIHALVSALAQSSENSGKYIHEQIETLDMQNKEMETRLSELIHIADDRQLTDNDFHLLKNRLSSFSSCYEHMSIEEKRAALRVFVKRIEWDGENVHLYLFGDEETTITPAKTQREDSKRDPDVFPG